MRNEISLKAMIFENNNCSFIVARQSRYFNSEYTRLSKSRIDVRREKQMTKLEKISDESIRNVLTDRDIRRLQKLSRIR